MQRLDMFFGGNTDQYKPDLALQGERGFPLGDFQGEELRFCCHPDKIGAKSVQTLMNHVLSWRNDW